MKTYKSYTEIPGVVGEYILTVAGVNDLQLLSLETINSYLSGLDDYYSRSEEREKTLVSGASYEKDLSLL
jgi:hypothetical protein